MVDVVDGVDAVLEVQTRVVVEDETVVLGAVVVEVDETEVEDADEEDEVATIVDEDELDDVDVGGEADMVAK